MEVALPRFDVGDGPGGARDAPRRAGDPRRRPARDDGARPDARDLRRRARRPAGRVAGGLRRRGDAVHAGVAGGDHVGRPAAGGQGRARVRAQRGGQRRALDDLHGRGHQPLVSLRRDLPLVHRAAAARRLRRDQRRRLGALRRPGEDPHVRRLADARVRARLAAPAAPGAGHVVVLPAHRAVALRPAAPGAVRVAARRRPVRGA